MRHGKKFNHLGRTSSHRKALLKNLTISLLQHKRITTTLAKAKALRKYVEPIINRSKVDSTANRRLVFSYLQDKESVKILYAEIADKVADRPGGYTRIIKLSGGRVGDNAETALIELVDFNLLYSDEKEAKKASRRTRRTKKSDEPKSVVVEDAVVVEETPAVEEAKPEEEAPSDEASEETKPEA